MTDEQLQTLRADVDELLSRAGIFTERQQAAAAAAYADKVAALLARAEACDHSALADMATIGQMDQSKVRRALIAAQEKRSEAIG